MDFAPNTAGIASITQTREARAALADAAKTVATEAVRNAPIGNAERGVHYQDTIHGGAPYTGDDGALVAEVYTTDPNGALIEFGSVNNPPYRTITGAAQECGLTVDDPGPS